MSLRTVGLGGFKSVAEAIQDILDRDPPSTSNRALVIVEPGPTWAGDFTVPAYVTVRGMDAQASVLMGTATVLPIGRLVDISLVGVVRGLNDGVGYWYLKNLTLVNMGATGAALSIEDGPNPTPSTGGLVEGCMIGSNAQHCVRITSGAGVNGVVEYYFEMNRFELYGSAGLSAMRVESPAMSIRSRSCVYQIPHATAPNALGLDSVGVNFDSYHDTFETNGPLVGQVEAAVPFVRVDGGSLPFKARVRLWKPGGYRVGNGRRVNGGTIEVL